MCNLLRGEGRLGFDSSRRRGYGRAELLFGRSRWWTCTVIGFPLSFVRWLLWLECLMFGVSKRMKIKGRGRYGAWANNSIVHGPTTWCMGHVLVGENMHGLCLGL